MPLLLVDDRDGRVLAEVRSPEEAQHLLESLWSDEPPADYLCLVEIQSHHGSIIGTDTSVKVRPLS
jgi:hypothetical protein